MDEFLSAGFLHRAFLAGVVVSGLCGVLSVFIVLRKMAFIGVGISHSAFGGVALGLVMAMNPFWTGLAFASMVALLIEWARSAGKVEEDTAIGILFSASMALGVIFLHLSRTYNVDVFGFLFGNILAVGKEQLWEVSLLALGVAVCTICLFKEFVFLSFDEAMAWVSGLPVTFLRYFFSILLALTVIVSIYLVGIVLVEALLVIPGAISRNLAREIKRMTLVSASVAVAATVVGLGISYWLDLPPGAVIVAVLCGGFFLAALRARKARMS
jgi:zinc transport system permease protein